MGSPYTQVYRIESAHFEAFTSAYRSLEQDPNRDDWLIFFKQNNFDMEEGLERFDAEGYDLDEAPDREEICLLLRDVIIEGRPKLSLEPDLVMDLWYNEGRIFRQLEQAFPNQNAWPLLRRLLLDRDHPSQPCFPWLWTTDAPPMKGCSNPQNSKPFANSSWIIPT